MSLRVSHSLEDVRDLEILIRANHPLILLETDEPERAEPLVRWVADRLALPFIGYNPDRGLFRPDLPSFSVEGSSDAQKCLDYVAQGKSESLYYLDGLYPKLESEPLVVRKLAEIAHRFAENRSAVLMTASAAVLPSDLQRLTTTLRLSSPSPEQYYAFVRELLRDLRRRMPVSVKLSGEEVARLLTQLQGLTLFEVKKILTKVIVEDGGTFNADDIGRIAEAKKEIIERSGVLEYFSADERMSEVAGLSNLKDWLGKRKLAFSQPLRAKEFGLLPPRGILLLGVQGCGKSMCAKAIAKEWELPLIRLDPSNLYNKYFGESEKNLKRATRTAETMAPIVLWIDEMEKAFAQGGGDDSGTSTRIFGSFLSWMQEKKPGVFVVATCNDITRLPPELVRKGRFDEIFFVDLPNAQTRKAILGVHLTRRGRDPGHYDLDRLAERTDGFSGAELEQVVLAGLYSAFAQATELQTQHIDDEITRTVPLSTTMSEQIGALRSWATHRAVPAD
jgi:AAA+ superfamily predicted ATPase